jgi:hypothetical protein
MVLPSFAGMPWPWLSHIKFKAGKHSVSKDENIRAGNQGGMFYEAT